MGGTIDVESELGKGSKFTVVLKHHLAEDNDLNAEITITLLEDIGLIVERVEDGIQCVAKMEQMPAKSYDLILMDIQMPIMNGYEAATEIRKIPKYQNVPIIALTAGILNGEREKCLEYGMNDYLSKPILAKDLQEMIQKWVLIKD